MPIGGIVITGRAEDTDAILTMLEPLDDIEIHGNDDSGNKKGYNIKPIYSTI